MATKAIKAIKKVEPRHAATVTLESPVLPDDQALSRDFAKAQDSADVPALPYDAASLPGGDEVTGGRKLEYDIAALPGRRRFDITNNGKAVRPTTGPEALGYYGVSKKAGANIANLAPNMIPAIGELAAATKDLRLPAPVLTSGNDGQKHKKTSLHYKDRAADFRGNNIADERGYALRDMLRTRLGPRYDIFFEKWKDPSNDHIHIEYDPPKK